MDSNVNATLESLALAAKHVQGLPVPEEDTPDVAGRTRQVETGLSTWRLNLIKEIDTDRPVRGRQYVLVPPSGNNYSFNESKILTDILDAEVFGGSLSHAISFLIDSGAMTLKFGFTALVKAFDDLDLPLTTVAHEVEDGDEDAHVGKVKKKGAPTIKVAKTEGVVQI